MSSPGLRYAHTEKEGLTGIIDLPDDDPVFVEALLKHCYLTPYAQISTELIGSIEPIMFHISVYAIAEKYGITDLKKAACNSFKRLPCDEQQQASFVTAVRHAYEMTPETDLGLRRAIHVVTLRDWTKLLQCDDTVKEFVQGMPSKVIMWLLLDLNTRFGLMREYRCPACENTFVAELDDMVEQYCIYCGNKDDGWAVCCVDFTHPKR